MARVRLHDARPPGPPPAGLAAAPAGWPAVLAPLFSPGAAGVLARVADSEPSCHHPSERAAVGGAGLRRRREFLAGRACAHAALRAVGRDGHPLGRGEEREPLWPPGVVGSISHAEGLVGAVVAPAAAAWGVGLDIELLDPPLDAAVERLVLAPAELARPDPTACLAAHRTKVAFAVKECVYKGLFPRTRWPLELRDVTVEIDADRGRYRALVDDRFRLAGLPLAPLEGRFTLLAGHILVGLWIGAGGPVTASAGPGPGTDRSPRARRPPRACSSAYG